MEIREIQPDQDVNMSISRLLKRNLVEVCISSSFYTPVVWLQVSRHTICSDGGKQVDELSIYTFYWKIDRHGVKGFDSATEGVDCHSFCWATQLQLISCCSIDITLGAAVVQKGIDSETSTTAAKDNWQGS